MYHRAVQAVAFVLLLSFAAAVSAGTIYLKNGSIVHGEITGLSDGQLAVTTTFAGDIVIDMGAVRGMTTDQPLTVSLSNGAEVTGRLVYKPGRGQRIVDTALGAGSLAIARITALRSAGAPDPDVVALREELAEPRANLWTSEILLGIGGSSGNSESFTFSLGINAAREEDNDRLYLSLLANRAKQDGEKTVDETIATVRLEHDFSKNFFVFGQTELESAEFENIALRSTTLIGPGYVFIREEGQQLKGRLGLGYEYISPEVGADQSEVVLALGYDYYVDVLDWLRFSHSLTYIPQITNEPGKNFRIESVIGLETPLGDGSNWSVLAQYRHDYKNNPPAGVEELDTTYQINLVYDFD